MIEKDNVENEICVIFRCEIHLIKNLKVNILIDNDIMKSKNIVVNLKNRTTYIDNCNIIVLMKIRTSSFMIFKFIYLRKTIIILFRSKIFIEIHHFAIFNNRDFLFEFNKMSYFTSYAHLINTFINVIVLRNNFIKSI